MAKNLFRFLCFSVCGIVVATLFGACRSYNDRAWRSVEFVSDPPRATLFVNGKNCGLTPREEILDRRGNYEVRFSKPGYFDETVVIASFVGADELPDIVDKIDIRLEKITPDALSARERPASPEKSENAPAKAVSAGTPAGMSPAAAEFSKREKPVNFTDFRLQEKILLRLLENGEISQEEHRTLHEELYKSYNETRLLKAPRLGTYEQ